MRHTRFSPAFDVMEERLALSTTVTTHEYRMAKADIRAALRTNGERSAALLARAAARIPSGSTTLLPAWTAEAGRLSIGDPRPDVRASIFRSLDSHLHRGILAREIVVRGPAALKVSRAAIPTTSADTFLINRFDETLSVLITNRSTGKGVYLIRYLPENSLAIANLGDPDEAPAEGYFIQAFSIGTNLNFRALVPKLANVRVTFLKSESGGLKIETGPL